MKKKILLLIGVLFLITGCAKMAGINSDYKVLNAKEIEQVLTDHSVIEKSNNMSGKYSYKKMIAYLGANKKYFKLNGKLDETAVVDYGKWYTKNKSTQGYVMGYLCFHSDLYKTDSCYGTLVLNGGKYRFNLYAGDPLQIEKGNTLFAKEIQKIPQVSLNYLKQMKDYVGINTIFAQKEKQEKIRILEEKKRKERERLARLKREREERARQARLAKQRSYSSSGSYSSERSITICIPSIPRPVEYSQCTISSGGFYATVKLSRGGGMSSANCFDLNIYHSGSIAVANTCGGVNGSWSYNVNGSSGFANGIGQTISRMVRQMR